jgi:hypothetical protein
MKTAALCSIAFVCASAAFAQTSPVSVAETPKPITLTGCVARGTNAQPITLANAMVIPSTESAGATATSPSPLPDAVSPPTTQPPPAVGTSGAAAAGSPASPTTGAVGTSGSIIGTAPAGSSASSVSGYQLSGTDMTSWLGRRVQIVGTVVPAASGTPAVAASGSTAPGTVAMPQFRVVSVQPITGECSER